MSRLDWLQNQMPAALAAAIRRYIELGENYFLPHLRSEKQKYSWTVLTNTIFELSELHVKLKYIRFIVSQGIKLIST